MSSLLFFFLLSTLTLVNATSSHFLITPRPSPCPNILPRIVGGHATLALKPYMAALFDPLGTFLCSGTLVSNRWIITAAHCRVTVDWHVRLGGETAYLGERRNISFVAAHPFYDEVSAERDIAVIQLETPAQKSAKTALVNWNFSHPLPGSYAKAVGYGVTFEGQSAHVSDKSLHAVDVPIISWKQCRELYAPAQLNITKQMICAGREGCDSCQGDSGGGLVQFAKGGKVVLMGVVSFGVGCARGAYPGVYTMVSKMKWWLEKVGCQFEGGVAEQVFG